MGGLWACIGGFVTLLIAIFVGKKLGVDKGKAKANEAVLEARSEAAEAVYQQKVAQAEKETAQAVTPVVTESAAKQAQAQAEYNATISSINNARRNNDMDAISRIAMDMASKAFEKGVKEITQ